MEPEPVNEDFVVTEAKARLGRVVKDKYRLDSLLGVGGMAAVYAATHRNGSRAAIKILHRSLSANTEVRSRTMREGYVANRVGHPGTVRVLDDDIDDGSVFLVMELLEGESVDQRWERQGLVMEVEEVLTITDRVLDILAAAHDKGIVHRDIKPENVFLTRDGVLKLLDFGIAGLRELSVGGKGSTQIGLSMGTPNFMPPEQARGRWDEVGPQSDLWAVGAMMFALLTGRYVHQAATQNEQLLLAMTEPAAPLASLRPELSPSLCALVDKTLAFDRANRFADAKAMQAAVREVYRALIGTSPSTAPLPKVSDTNADDANAVGTTSDTFRAVEWRTIARTLVTAPRRRMAAIVVGCLGLGFGLTTLTSLAQSEVPTARLAVAAIAKASTKLASSETLAAWNADMKASALGSPSAAPVSPSPTPAQPQAPSTSAGTARKAPRSDGQASKTPVSKIASPTPAKTQDPLAKRSPGKPDMLGRRR